ncbi:MAG: sodium/solute symporter, partial [Deltaproteobacteria bacterium]|nr:sodium/solute symporter [Deltaproteobacteria bacterium]
MDGSGIPGFEGLDFLVLGLYFAGIVAVVWWSSRKQDTPADYFLASRNIGWFIVGASLFASNICSEHIVGLSGNGATSGMAMAHWELHAWILIMLGWVFVPFYKRSGVYTMPEFLEKRFNPKARWILSIVSLVAYVFTKVSVTVYAGGMVFSVLLPDTFGTPDNAFWVGALATVILTGIYTVLGGLRAVLYTDTVQTFILIIGSIFITIIGLNALGGWGELQEICRSNAENFSLWRPNSNPDFPWLGILLASPIVGIWYWCTDQYIVQRTLAAKNLRNARRGTIWGGFLKVWPVLIFLLPGLIGYALHLRGIIQIPTKIVDGQTIINGDKVFPTMVGTLLPPGLRGIVVGGLLAALMSSLSSLFNSCASLFTIDIYEKINPQASERKLVTVGRLATGVVVVLGILWIPIMPMISEGGLYKYLQSVQGYLAPPITAVFLLGLFSKRINSAGAVIGLGTGFILGMAKLTIQALVGGNQITEPGWIVAIGEYNFLFASAWLFGISVVIIVIASLLTKKPDPAQISGLTFATATKKDKKETRASWNRWDIIGTTVVLSLVLGIYLYFSFWLKKDYQPIKPVPFTQVKIQDDFWLPRIETNHSKTIPYALKMCEETGRIDNFAIAGGIINGEHSGKRYNDSDVYKIIEGASYSLALHHDKELETYIDSLIAMIAAAQEDDGYLFTTRTIDPERPAEGSGDTRWSMLNSSHELYNVGHMYEAAVAQFQTTGKRTLLDVALRNADLIVSVFGPGKKRDVPGHQEIEIGLAKLFRVTGKEEYLDMAKFFLDERGLPHERKPYPDSSNFAIYNQSEYLQDHKPVLEQKEAVGHAVRASYMYIGMADIAALTQNKDYVKAIDLIWDNVVSKKLYITGGIGARYSGESFGDNYELPNFSAYSETCASVGNAMWNHRLFLLHGH